MRRLPIRGKFALWAAALVGCVLLVFAGGTFVNLYHEQLEAVDLELDSQRRHFANLSDRDLTTRTLEELVGFQPWLAVAVFDPTGRPEATYSCTTTWALVPPKPKPEMPMVALPL